jgi:hypothetical protein
MLRKSYQYMTHELKSLGCKLVHGDFNKIIVATDKTNFADAET